MKNKLTVAELQFIFLCIDGVIGTSEKMSGATLCKLNNIANIIKPYIESFNDTKSKIINDYAVRDEKGKLIQEKKDGGYVFKFEEDVVDKVNEEIQSALQVEIDIEITKIPMSIFEKLEFNTSKIKGLDVFINLVIDEKA